jgi:Zn-dependent protease
LRCGDSTARDLGRLTLNPLPHIDPFMTIVLPAASLLTSGFMFGGAKPVPVNFHRLRHPLRDMTLVAIAGPLSNLLLAALFCAAFHFFVSTGYYRGANPDPQARAEEFLPQVLFYGAYFNVILAVFNLLPIPPLDGGRVLTGILPYAYARLVASLEPFGFFILMMLLMTRSLGAVLDAPVQFLLRVLL